MEGDGNDVIGVRVSGRLNKGVPPSRFGHEDSVSKSVPPPKSISSKASSARRRSQAEAERDVKIANLTKEYASKKKDSKVLDIKIKSTQAKFDKAIVRYRATSNPEDEKIYDQLSVELEKFKTDKQLVDVELESMEMSHAEELQAIKSTCQAELDQIEEDEDIQEVIAVDNQARTVNWAAELSNSAEKVQPENLAAGYSEEINEDYDEHLEDLEERQRHNDKELNHYVHPPTHQYVSGPSNQPAFKHTGKDFQPGAHQTYQQDVPAAGSHQQSSSKEVTMHDLVNALKTFGSKSHGSEIVMKTTIDKDLPKFGGEPAEWVQFKSEFDRTTKKLKIDNSENMIRLRKSLVGQAKTTVQHLMVNVDNVTVIMESLEKRFGRPRVVLNALAAKAKACGNVTIAKPDSIIEFGLAIQALVANVRSFKSDGYLHSTELLETLVKKLSPELATRWFEWLTADITREDNLIGFSAWTTIQLDIAYQRADYKYEDTWDERGDHRRRRGPGAMNVITTEDGNCTYCQKRNHILEKCWSFQKKSLDERWDFVKSSKACICCLKQGHRARDCKTGSKCDVNRCNRYHHRLLHNNKKIENGDNEKENKLTSFFEDEDDRSPVKLHGNFAVIAGCDGPLPIVPVKLSGPNGTVKCHTLLDTGASRSLVKKRIAEKIGLKGIPTEYSYTGITGEVKMEKDAQLVNCNVASTLQGSKFMKLRSAITVEDIKMNPFTMNVEEIKRKWPHLKNVAASNLLQVTPDVVIGNNNPRLILARKLVLGKDDEPVGWRSELGWAISGNFDNAATGMIIVMRGSAVSNDKLHPLIKKSFSFNKFGVKPATMKGKNWTKKGVYSILEQTTKKAGDCCEVGLLRCEDNVQFPDSQVAAMKRLHHMDSKMRNLQFMENYPKAANAAVDHFYVDDCLSGGKIEENAIELRKQLCEIHDSGNFNLCKFISNYVAVLESIPEDLRADTTKDFEDKNDLPGEQVLGILGIAWPEDAFQLQLGLHKVNSKMLGGDIPTKREMCQLIMSLFDSLGQICHFKVKALSLLQEVWSTGIGCDVEIPYTAFIEWKKRLGRQDEVKLPNGPETWKFAEDQKRIQNEGTVAILVTSEQCNLNEVEHSISELVQGSERLLSFIRLVRAAAAVLQAAHHWHWRFQKQDTQPPWSWLSVDMKAKGLKTKNSSDFSVDSLMEAEKLVIKLAQWESYGAEVKILQDVGQLKRKGKFWKLFPIIDNDGLLRAEGRIDAAKEIPERMKIPIILPPRSHITELIVDKEHVRCAHQGLETVFNGPRKSFWIVDARHTVKRSWKRCGVCCLTRVKPLNPKIGNLPDFRLASNQPALIFTGIHLFSQIQGTVGRRHEKLWGVLICCIVTRALNLLTILKSNENIDNSRPLTFVTSVPMNPLPINPNDILRGGCDTGPSIPAVIDYCDNHMRQQWKRSQVLANEFWKRWTSDYLPKLVRREKWQEPTEPLKTGDLVFLVNENLPRNCWLRGVLSQMFPGKDGEVRLVEATTRWNSAGKKENKFRWPVVKCCPLGLKMEIKGSQDP